ncbi:hypothetical protein HIM_05973 [Hirsutella minnesotensis 3608]|uniref:Siderophore biosynthesis enzyme n=1 Tax=Hirsutella minnesotensis 3608 TaxID=1043627 RepID=A0A0F7ZUC5_9HYPO|nr:hypothetical protein HIM_05973 [Hirsutella minnesotensis 3608]
MAFRSLIAASLAAAALARTDLQGCTHSDTVVKPTNGGTPYASRIWYVPGSGEVCQMLDCGGGRAPPKTTVPGCPLYRGTETYMPSFINVKTPAAAPAGGSSSTNAPATPTPSTGSGSSMTVMHTTAAPTMGPTEKLSSAPTAAQTTKSSGIPAPAEVSTGTKDDGQSEATGSPMATESMKTSASLPSLSNVINPLPTGAAMGLGSSGAVVGSVLMAGAAAGMMALL